MSFVKAEITNQERFANTLRRAFAVVDDLTIPFNQIGNDFFNSNRSIFLLKGPGKFPPFTGAGQETVRLDGFVVHLQLSPYQRRKIRKFGFDYPLLRATGKLEDSVTNPNSPNAVFINTGKSLEVGSDEKGVPYGVYHNSDRPRGKIPLRKFIYFGPEAPTFAPNQLIGRAERWLNILNTFVLRKLGVAFEQSVRIDKVPFDVKDIKE